jgi:hypothetical protein
VSSHAPREHLPPYLQQIVGELWVTYVDRLSQWETKVRTMPPDEAEKFVKRLIVERAVADKRAEVSHRRRQEDNNFLLKMDERRANPEPYENCEIHPLSLKTVNFQHHALSYFCTECWRAICPLCYGSCCRNHSVRTIETILRGVEDSIARGQEQRNVLIREEEKKRSALMTLRERLLAEGNKDEAKRIPLCIKRCNERIASAEEYVETLRAQLKFLQCHFNLPGVGNAESTAAVRLKEWFQAHGVGADWQGPNLSVKPDIVEPPPDDETEALTRQALALGNEPVDDDDTPPMLIAIEPQKT